MNYSLRSLMLAANPGEDFIYWFMDEWVPLLINAFSLASAVYGFIACLWYYRQGKMENAVLCGVCAAGCLVVLVLGMVLIP
jgi:hypothetical protein